MNEEKRIILDLFYKNVQGFKADVSGFNENHDGKMGHWLERQFGVSANSSNSADLLGYELKDQTSSKTTFGDWSANRYIYKDGEYIHLFGEGKGLIKQNNFCRIFGKSNPLKSGRFSWSGSPCPKINHFNFFGQILLITENLDIHAVYSYSKDQRKDKAIIVPLELQKEDLVIAIWFGVTSPSFRQKDKCLKTKLEDKFNDCGWFTCKKDADGIYQKICFGEPITYEKWIEFVRMGLVYFDSGMFQGNKRPYSQWRADNNFWDSLITEFYE